MPRATKHARSDGRRAPKQLSAYQEKRDFTRTGEPPPKRPPRRDGPLTFVVQKHNARQLHYDFRLELDGVLKSWAVPKGPSFDPQDKRLATMVEDHPIDYGSFEGVIPRGEYGAGQVIVWDHGTYSPDEDGLVFDDRVVAEERMRSDLDRGKLSITLRGQKLKGSWTLVKMERAEDNAWLLIKHKDSQATSERDILDENRSVISGLTIEDIQEGRLPERSRPGEVALNPVDLPGARRAALPGTIAPMLATLADKPFSDPRWLFEPKLDGVRAVAVIRDGEARLISRRGLDATKQYPSVAGDLAQQPANQLALDGEIVALDDDGRPSFEVLQQRINLSREADIRRMEAEVPVYYYVFDVLYVDGYDMRAVPLERRKELLAAVLAPTNGVLLVQHFEEDGVTAYNAAVQYGFEGVVAKRRDSLYESGTRSKTWLKIKGTQTDDFIVGGYTAGEGGRSKTFGALLLGQYQDGELVYTGSVGSGFDDKTLDALRRSLDALAVQRSPFATPVPIKAPITWARPELVVEVKFAQWTRDRLLRAPVFLRLREDKPPAEVEHIEVAHVVSTASGEPDPPADMNAEEVLDQLEGNTEKLILRVDGHRIPLTNLNKELWPKLGRRRALTKRDLLVYFAQAAPYLIPHLRDRPLTLTRYPNGIGGQFFFQKHWESPLPEFVDTVRLYSSHNEGDQEYLMCNNLPTLLWLGQLADLELHIWYSRVDPEPDGHRLSKTFAGSEDNIDGSLLNYPDFIVFDLDPYIYSGREAKGAEPELNRKAFAKTCEVAAWVKDVLDSLSLSSFLKTTGKTGLHIYVPIVRNVDYASARAACETIGRFVLQQHPRDITMDWTVEKRAGKIFLDHNQNVRGKTLAAIYSPRPLPEAAVSMPLRWDELGKFYPSEFTILSAPKRLAEVGDLWADILQSKHDLEGLLTGGGGKPGKPGRGRARSISNQETRG